jgi:branched-chain amino acid transport system substrate-binding protein
MLAVCAAAAAILVLSGGGKQDRTELRIGVIAPFTGDLSSIGRSTMEGARLAVDEINESGGVLVENRRLQIMLIPEDSMASPETAVQAAHRLINQHEVQALIGPVLSLTALPVAEIADRAGIPMITPSATNPLVISNRRCVYRTCFGDKFQGEVIARFCFQELAARRAAVLYDVTNVYNRTVADMFRHHFQLLGGDVAAFEGYTPDVDDFAAPLQRITELSPQVLVIPNYRPDTIRQVFQARKAGFSGYIMGSDTMNLSDPEDFDLLEGAYFTTHFAPELPFRKTVEFSSRYRRAYQRPPTVNGALTYDAVHLLAAAADELYLQGCRGLDSVTFDGVTGTIKFTAQRPEKDCIIMRYSGGQRHYIMKYKP